MAIINSFNQSQSSESCGMTILVCSNVNSSTKQFTCDGKQILKTDFNAGMHFGVIVKNPKNIHQLSSALTALEKIPEAFVIRGAPQKSVDKDKPCRRLNINFKTPNRGLHWVLIDTDKYKLPDHLSLHEDIAAVLEHLVGLMPKEFRDSSYHWQLSSSAGMSDPGVVSAHIWFWFNRPVSDLELRNLAKYVNDCNQFKLIDPALFRDVQPHYTAAPIFKNIDDPFPKRSGLVSKKHDMVVFQTYTVAEPMNSPAASAINNARQPNGANILPQKLITSQGTKFDAHMASIGDHAGGNGFHEPIIRAIACYAAINGKDGTDVETLYALISKRVTDADSSQHPKKSYIKRMASREHIIPAIQTAILKYGNKATTKKTPLIEGITPPKRGKRISVADAYKALSNNIAKWL